MVCEVLISVLPEEEKASAPKAAKKTSAKKTAPKAEAEVKAE